MFAGAIERRVLARIKERIAKKQEQHDEACAAIDDEVDTKIDELREKIMVVEGSRASKKAEAADRLADEVFKGLA